MRPPYLAGGHTMKVTRRLTPPVGLKPRKCVILSNEPVSSAGSGVRPDEASGRANVTTDPTVPIGIGDADEATDDG